MRIRASLVAVAVTVFVIAASTASAQAAPAAAPKNGDLVFAEGIGGIVTQTPGASTYKSLTAGVQPKYSPDGRQVAFLDSPSASQTFQIKIRTISSGAERVVASFDATTDYYYWSYLAWSPDAKSLVVSIANRLVKVNVGSGAKSTIYTATTAVKQPAWSPDGTRIAFSTGDAIKLITPQGTGLRTLTTGGSNTFPDWRPDSKALAFITTRYAEKSELVTLPRDGKGQPFRVSHKAYPQGLFHIGVAWSPDGKKIAVLQFNANHPPNDQDTDERFKVRGYLPDGSHSYSLTGPIVGDDGPEGLDWAPKVTN